MSAVKRPIKAVMDSIEAIAIGLVCSTVIFILLREIILEVPLKAALSKAIYESVPFTLGVAVSNQFLSGKRNEEGGSQKGKAKQQNKDQLNATLADMSATLIGAVIIGFNISPTDEIDMLSKAVLSPWLLALMAASLSETIASYLVSLIASSLMLYFFHQVSFDDPWSIWLSYFIILGLPATIGGAAGRLAL